VLIKEHVHRGAQFDKLRFVPSVIVFLYLSDIGWIQVSFKFLLTFAFHDQISEYSPSINDDD